MCIQEEAQNSAWKDIRQQGYIAEEICLTKTIEKKTGRTTQCTSKRRREFKIKERTEAQRATNEIKKCMRKKR